jgi:predicted nucleotidyltransferase component of viral defense system
MRAVAKLPSKDLRALFTNTADKTGMTVAIIEKDFWVCWTLDYLFHRCKWKNNLAFKGGTSLSKAYHLIQRFSEDIDIILDWRMLGYAAEEPWSQRSNTKQDIFNKEANKRAEVFLRDEFVPAIKADLTAELGLEIHIAPDANDGQTILLTYPQEFTDNSIVQEIRLEIGALAAWTPATAKNIESYAVKEYPHLFDQPQTSVLTVLPERTFWEKVSILHKETHRSEESPFPQRYSRHYYDLFCMSATKVKERSFADLDLLDKVVAFKRKFYPSKWANYDSAKIGTMKLIPPPTYIELLRDDYAHMQNMIFGDRPDFDELMAGIEKLETEMNALGTQKL